jgi:hypothetical protein
MTEIKRHADPMGELPRAAIFLDVGGMADDQAEPDAIDLAGLSAAVDARVRAVSRIAYADWARLPRARQAAAEAGFDQVQIGLADRASAGLAVRIAVDAMEIAAGGSTIEAFVLIGAGPALAPLVRALRRRGRHVVVVVPEREARSPLRDISDDFLIDDGEVPPVPARPAPKPVVLPVAPRPEAEPAMPPPRITAADPAPAPVSAPRGPALSARADEPAAPGARLPPLTADPPPAPERRGLFGRR